MIKKYHVIAYGCQFNKSDGERIARLLEKNGYGKSPAIEGADLVVIVMCSVRQKSVDRVKNKIKTIKNSNLKAKIILTGCVLEADKKFFEKIGIEIKNFKDLEKITPTSSLVPITIGCDNFCSYCVVPYTRGREKHRPVKNILREVKKLIKNGIDEITLIGQNVNSYKSNVKSNPKSKLQIVGHNFADLLRIINDLPGNFKIKFLTNHPKDMSEKLIQAIAECEKVKKEIHLPFQAGDNTILKKMNRRYTRQDYLLLVKKIRQVIPDVVLTTDIIVGFPGETKKQFEKTIEVMKKACFHRAFIAKYSPRAGTAAFKLKDDVPLDEKKRREQVLLALLKK